MNHPTVIVCRVGRLPVLETLKPDRRGGYLDAMQAIVGGYVRCLGLDDGIELWCNEDGEHTKPLNRCFPGIAPSHEGYDFVIKPDDSPEPGQPGVHKIHGDFFLARARATDDDGIELASVTDADFELYLKRFDREDVEAARRQNRVGVQGCSPTKV